VEETYPLPVTKTNDEGRKTNYDLDQPVSVHRPSSIVFRPSSFVLDWGPMVEAILEDLQRGVKPGIMAGRFHNTLAEAILAVARSVGERRVALTGGCFQNRLLTERAAQRLGQAGFEVLLHRQVPPNDGGISLGQVVVAAARLERGI
jgi:hydrogenase maturation protein HypF